MHALRNSVAAAYRGLPPFKGKARLGAAIGSLLERMGAKGEPVVTLQMRDGSVMPIDIRSRTEKWAYWTGEYDRPVIEKLKACFGQDWTVFDVGANIGFYTIPLGRRLRELGGKLYAFEPVPSNFTRLSSAVELNALADTVTVNRVALGNEFGTVPFHFEDDGGATTGNAVMVREKVKTENQLSVNAEAPLMPLDHFVKENGITRCDFIKIDIEGAEVMFLRGGAEFLSRTHPVIYGEFNRYWLGQFGSSFLDVIEIVRPWGYRFYREAADGSFEEFQPEKGAEDVLLLPPNTPESVIRALKVKAS